MFICHATYWSSYEYWSNNTQLVDIKDYFQAEPHTESVGWRSEEGYVDGARAHGYGGDVVVPGAQLHLVHQPQASKIGRKF